MEGIGESGGVAQAACWENSELREAQLGDESLRDVIKWLEEKKRPKWEQVFSYKIHKTKVKAYWAQWNSLELHDGVLYRKFENSDHDQARLQLIDPKVIAAASSASAS